MQVGRYEILEELGRGGMARVHLARQAGLDRLVALKELGILQREDAEMVSRFLRESRLAGALNHPNIVTVHEFFEHGGMQYIAMEYVPGGSLRPWTGKLSVAQVGGVFEALLAGLANAHAAGVVHRDLKPENLMVTGDGRIKIADFGIAKALADGDAAAFRTATGVAIGTPSYMSPEQAMAKEVGPWTDLYAAGVIAYEALSGRLPFEGGEPMAVLLAHCNTEPPPLAEVAPDVPAPLAAWVHALLAKDGAARPQTARAAWEDLEEVLLEVIGPRWRRQARIEGKPGAPAPPSRPVTPASFPSERTDPDPEDDWQTVAGGAVPPAPPPAEPPAPEPPPEPDEPEPAPAPEPPPEPTPAQVTRAPTPAPSAAASPAPAPSPAPASPPPAAPAPPPAPAPAPDRPGSRRGLLAGLALLAVVAGVAAVLVLGGGGDGEPGSEPAGAPRVEAPAEPVAIGDYQSFPLPLGDDWIRAVNIWSYESDGWEQPEFAEAVETAARTGATHVIVHPALTPASATASTVDDQPATPRPETLGAALEAINDAGLRAIIQPTVNVDGAYAGLYAPDDPETFLEDYRRRMAAFADTAREHDVDVFVVGTQLNIVEGPDYLEQWRFLIDDVRTRCECRISYVADGIDAAKRIRLWDEVDLIGVNEYLPLTESPTLDPDVIARGWRDRRAQLQRIADREGLPLWLPEIGYSSRANQSAESVFAATGEPSEVAQAANYEGTFRAFQGQPWFAGIGWFELNGDGERAGPGDYLFDGKLAEQVLLGWHAAQ